jgi:hypothetical protein
VVAFGLDELSGNITGKASVAVESVGQRCGYERFEAIWEPYMKAAIVV